MTDLIKLEKLTDTLRKQLVESDGDRKMIFGDPFVMKGGKWVPEEGAASKGAAKKKTPERLVRNVLNLASDFEDVHDDMRKALDPETLKTAKAAAADDEVSKDKLLAAAKNLNAIADKWDYEDVDADTPGFDADSADFTINMRRVAKFLKQKAGE